LLNSPIFRQNAPSGGEIEKNFRKNRKIGRKSLTSAPESFIITLNDGGSLDRSRFVPSDAAFRNVGRSVGVRSGPVSRDFDVICRYINTNVNANRRFSPFIND